MHHYEFQENLEKRLTKKIWNYIICLYNKTWKGEKIMDNQKILEAARKNKNKGKEYENKASANSSLLGAFAAVIVGIVLFLLEYFIKDSVNVGLIAVLMTASGVQSLYEGIKVKKLYLTIIGVIQILMALFAILVVIWQVVSI